MCQEGHLLENVEQWLDFIDARNKSSHIAMEVMKVIPDFLLSVQALSQKL